MNQEELEFKARTHVILDGALNWLNICETGLDRIPDAGVATMQFNCAAKISEYKRVYGRDEHNSYNKKFDDDIIKKADSIISRLNVIKQRVSTRRGTAHGKKSKKTQRKRLLR